MQRVDKRIVGAVLLLALIGAIDAVSPQIVLTPFVVVPVLLTSTFATARRTAWLGGLAIVTSVALGIPDDEFATGDHVIRTFGVAFVSVFAVYVAKVRQARESELRRGALHDPLTGLPNRALLADRLRQQLLRRSPTGLLAVLFVDLDGFKTVNDTYGHAAGDELLRHAARRLQTVTRAGDTLARFAGDEFVLLCPDLPDTAEATRMAERVQGALATPARLESREVAVTASVGVAVDESRNLDEHTLLRAADEAMFDAKRRGDHGYTVRCIRMPPTEISPARQPTS